MLFILPVFPIKGFVTEGLVSIFVPRTTRPLDSVAYVSTLFQSCPRQRLVRRCIQCTYLLPLIQGKTRPKNHTYIPIKQFLVEVEFVKT